VPDGRDADLRPLVEGLRGIESRPWQLAEIELVSSVLGANPKYRTEARWPLAGASRVSVSGRKSDR
jgi:hypothetical protein